eukprot:TRINITY_DN14838_c0_g1_i1.p1 TRINITY_DN14838_c0_g1~~TRINITY_DN14838_c0_g1_i1.p1  ORF type:complete len:514 (+),score=65.71 TRINITY_DN14838_c0_g1_i1:47-1588(+)
MVILKIAYQDDLHRLQTDQLSYDDLRVKITSMFRFSPQQSKNFVIYVGSEGAIIKNDVDLGAAFARTSPNATLRLVIIVPTVSEKAAEVEKPFVSFTQQMANITTPTGGPSSFTPEFPLTQSQLNLPDVNTTLATAFDQILHEMPKETMTNIVSNMMSTPAMQEVLSKFFVSCVSAIPSSTLVESLSTSQLNASRIASSSLSESRFSNVEHNIKCNNCEQLIVGTRYKCSSCLEYNLCESCEKLGVEHDESHPFLRLRKALLPQPSTSPAAVVIPPAFEHSAEFIKDVTLADTPSKVVSGIQYVKTWRFKNSGSAPWEGIKIVWDHGDTGNHKAVGDVPLTLPGQQVDVSVNITSAALSGRYVSYWRLMAPNSCKFGPRVWIDLLVEDSEKKDQEKDRQEKLLLEQARRRMEEAQIKAAQEKQIAEERAAQEKRVAEERRITEERAAEEKRAAEQRQREEQLRMAEKKRQDEKNQWGDAMSQLRDMGFLDFSRNAALLDKHKGDVMRVIQDLL